MPQPLISIIIAVWNGEKYLTEAIDSVLQQDYQHKEIIIVDDGSTDQTQKIIRQFGKSIISLYQENKGLGASRNTGVRLATGHYLAFLDHDDLWNKTKLSKQMAWILTQKTDPLVFTHVKQFICPTLSKIEKEKISVKQPILPGYIAGSLLLSKKRFAEIGFFIEEKKLGEFIEWYLRALAHNIPISMLPEVELYRRVHNNNMGRQLDFYKRSDYLKILKTNLDRRRSQIIEENA